MTSKPSATNCPKAFYVYLELFCCRLSGLVRFFSAVLAPSCRPYAPPHPYGVVRCRTNSGGYSGGVPPLPIPNREVKPARADGTAMQCGRVGRRLLLQRYALRPQMGTGGIVILLKNILKILKSSCKMVVFCKIIHIFAGS